MGVSGVGGGVGGRRGELVGAQGVGVENIKTPCAYLFQDLFWLLRYGPRGTHGCLQDPVLKVKRKESTLCEDPLSSLCIR